MAGEIYSSFEKKFPVPAEGALRVWWIPQIPGTQFWWPVKTLDEASLLLDALAGYDDFLVANKHRGEYSNAGGLCVYESGSWNDWEDPESGDDFDTYRGHKIKTNGAPIRPLR
jgi:hypothetical protein